MKNQYEIDFQQGYDTANDEWSDMIDKIKTEIENTMKYQYAVGENQYAEGFEKSLEIIDKCIAEREVTK